MLHDGRPKHAGQIVAAGDDRHGHAAPAVKPQRGIGDQGREQGRIAQHADQQALGKIKLPQAGGTGRQDKSKHQHQGPGQTRPHHPGAVGPAAHRDAADAKTDHGDRIGDRGV